MFLLKLWWQRYFEEITLPYAVWVVYKTNSQTTDPMYIFEYNETYEHHDTHSEESLNPLSITPLTFYEWY